MRSRRRKACAPRWRAELKQLRTVFLTFESGTAHILAARILELFRCTLGDDKTTWPGVAVDEEGGASPYGDPATDVAVLITFRDQDVWVERARESEASLRLVYIRPGLLAMRSAFGELWPPDAGARRAWTTQSSLDARLAGLPMLSMEQVHGGQAPLWTGLASLLEIPLDEAVVPGEPAAADRSTAYVAALHATVQPALGREPTERVTTAGAYEVRRGGKGLSLLGRGWASPEDSHVWSHGSLATLLIPNSGSDAPLTCRLQGFLVAHPDRSVKVLVSGGRDLAVLSGAVDQNCAFDIQLTLDNEPIDGFHPVAVSIDEPVRPKDVYEGSGDARPLAVGLQSIELGRAAEPLDVPDFLQGWPASTVVARKGRLALVCAARPAAARMAARVMKHYGADRAAVAIPVLGAAAQGGLEMVARVLALQYGRVDCLILCDREAIAAWLGLVSDPDHVALRDVDVLMNAGDPDACGLHGRLYAQRQAARIEMSEVATAILGRVVL